MNIDFLRSIASIAPRPPALPLGTLVEPYGRIGAVLCLSGERYYHLIDEHNVVSMMPAELIEQMQREQHAETFDRR